MKAVHHAVWGLIVISTLLRLAWAASLGPGNDEAYHALFVAHPDWSYFDHPPMLAIVEDAGLSLAVGGTSVLALRAGFIALFAGSTLLMARLTSRFYGPWAGFLAAFVLNVTAYFGVAASTFALPDGPLLFFWLLTLDRLAAALETPGRLRAWAWVGLAWGGALLSKYHAVFLPVGAALYLFTELSARPLWRRPGPYLALGLGLLCFAPVLAWNAAHGWASFAFQGGRALGSLNFRPDALAGAIAGQAMYYLPWVWAFLVVTLVRRLCLLFDGRADPADRFLLCQAAPPLAAFLAVACVRPVLPHWSLVGLLPVIPMLGGDWAQQWATQPARIRRRLLILGVVPVAGAALVALHVRTGLFQEGGGACGLVAAANDPTGDLFGWDELARELRRRGLAARPSTFLFTSRWYYSGQLAFALSDRMPVLCYNRRHAQNFAYWSRPEQWVGSDGIFIGINDCARELDDFARYFARIEPLGEYRVVRSGQAVRIARLYHCVHQTRPFPFGNAPKPTPHVVPSGSAGRPAGVTARAAGRQPCQAA
jgi:4-amino-4-deoxy-L-arabinose transferase-like glycosyltransferase